MKSSVITKLVFVVVILFCFQSIAQTESKKTPLYSLSFEELLDVEIYSGSKFNEPLKNIPANVTIISRQEIDKYGYITLSEILRNVPGLYLIDNTESIFIGIRGNMGGGVQFLVNGIPEHPSLQKGLHSTEINQFNIPVESIDRIEIIRGPMSVIYGNNAFQGTINIITNEVIEDVSALSFSYGNNGTNKLFTSFRKKSDDGFFVFNAGSYKTDGLTGLYSDMLDEEQIGELHPSAVSEIDGEMLKNNNNAEISFGYKKLIGNFRYNKMDYGFFPTSVGLGGKNNIKLTTKQSTLSYETELNSNTSIRTTGFYSTEEYFIPSMSFLTPTTVGNQTQTSKRSELEFNLMHKKGNIEFVSGYSYRKISNLRNRFFIQLSPESNPIVDFDKYIDDVNTNELFTQFLYKINSKLQVLAGIRYLKLPSSYDFTTYYLSANEITHDSTSIDNRSQFTGRIAVMVDFNDNNRLKLIAGTAAQDRDEIQFSQPEKITTFEVNELMTFDAFQLSASVFYNKNRRIIQRSIIVDSEGGSVIDVADNSGKWKTFGLEFIGQFNLYENFHFSGSFTIQKTDDDNFKVEVGYSPKFLFKVKAEYNLEKTNFGINGYYVSSMKSGYNLVETEKASLVEIVPTRLGDDSGGYFILGANVHTQFKNGIFLNFNGSNILGKEFRYPANELTTMTKGLIGMGRVIVFTAGYKF